MKKNEVFCFSFVLLVPLFFLRTQISICHSLKIIFPLSISSLTSFTIFFWYLVFCSFTTIYLSVIFFLFTLLGIFRSFIYRLMSFNIYRGFFLAIRPSNIASSESLAPSFCVLIKLS